MPALGEVVIIGGGCYGSFYLQQMCKARDARALAWRQLLVVDRDADCQVSREQLLGEHCRLVTSEWGAFLDGWLDRDTRSTEDRLIPSPLMPHLMAEWLERRARERWSQHDVAMVAAVTPAGTPYDALNPRDGVRYLSHADWLCPVHCIEPATCPMIKAPRQWEMSDTVREWTRDHGSRQPTAGPALFVCRHVSHGVGMYPVRDAFTAIDSLAEVVAGHGRGDLVVGSISACHGAVAVLRVGPSGVSH